MSSEPASPYPTVRTVTILYSELQDKGRDLSAKIREALGPNGLGMVSISDIPGYSFLRQDLLQLSPKLASLPDDVKNGLEDSDSRYNNGWNHGKQSKLDTYRASFIANPILDIPTTDTPLIERYPSFCRPNKWPKTALPEVEVAMKALGKMMLDIALMLAYHCDQYVSKATMVQKVEGLEQILMRSKCHKGCLLYYFPKPESECREDISSVSSWCSWHTDFGSLTGLTCGMFARNAAEITCPDSSAGLYIKTRNGDIVKVTFGEDELAFQIGETTEILSEGHLCATPHCVQAPTGENSIGIGRSTFAFFLQPNWDETLKFPGKIHRHQEFIKPNEVLTFGEYAEMVQIRDYLQKL